MTSINDVCVCSVCGTRLTKEQVVDGRVITRFEPFKKEKVTILDDGSYKRVLVCSTCDNK